MSLDNTSHPGRPGARRVGSVRAPTRLKVRARYLISAGGQAMGCYRCPGRDVGPTTFDPAVRAAWLEDMFLPPDVLEVGR